MSFGGERRRQPKFSEIWTKTLVEGLYYVSIFKIYKHTTFILYTDLLLYYDTFSITTKYT
jgi:hypothetical protein